MYKKKIALIFLVLWLLVCNITASKAEESENNGEASWDTFYKQYQKNDFGKIISEKDFDKAYRDRQGILSKEEELAKIKKIKYKAMHPSLFAKIFGKKQKGTPIERPPRSAELIEFNESTSPLLRLTQDAYYQGNKIPKGFYLIDLIIKDSKYYFAIREGLKTIITIEAAISNEPSKKEKVTFETELIDDITLKLKYFQPRGLLLESQLDFI